MGLIRSWISSGPVITDGAWGTELQKRGWRGQQPADLWNLTHPEVIREIASEYLAAGSQIILTNTFRANPIALLPFGLADHSVEINRRGVELARSVMTDTASLIFASLGPTGKRIDLGEIAEASAKASFKVQAQALADAGVDALIFETFSNLPEARLALEAARPTGLPIIVSFTFNDHLGRPRTQGGESAEMVARAMQEAGADSVGANCGTHPESFLEICRQFRSSSDLPLWMKPGAGLPEVDQGVAFYTLSSNEFANYGLRLIAAGANFVGGCCGTSPQFIAALKSVCGTTALPRA